MKEDPRSAGRALRPSSPSSQAKAAGIGFLLVAGAMIPRDLAAQQVSTTHYASAQTETYGLIPYGKSYDYVPHPSQDEARAWRKFERTNPDKFAWAYAECRWEWPSFNTRGDWFACHDAKAQKWGAWAGVDSDEEKTKHDVSTASKRQCENNHLVCDCPCEASASSSGTQSGSGSSFDVHVGALHMRPEQLNVNERQLAKYELRVIDMRTNLVAFEGSVALVQDAVIAPRLVVTGGMVGMPLVAVQYPGLSGVVVDLSVIHVALPNLPLDFARIQAECSAFGPEGWPEPQSPVVINEFCNDDPGVDDFEFVELFNQTDAPVDISGWRLVNADAQSPLYGGTGVDPTYVVPANTVLPVGGFWVIGSAATVNVNQVVPSPMLRDQTASIELFDASNARMDSVCYRIGDGAFGTQPLEGNGFYGSLEVGVYSGGPSSTTGRRYDGEDWNGGERDFFHSMMPTPGATNEVASALPYSESFDAGPVESEVSGWTRGFVAPRVVDPTVISASNPHVLPASPQGGRAMAAWDATGGGNTSLLHSAPVRDVTFEAYVWVEPTMRPVNPAPYTPTPPARIADTYNAADGEWWAIGVRGSAAANANPPDVGGYFNRIAMGTGVRRHCVSGIAWCAFRTTTFSQLYLIDFGNGSSPTNPSNWTVLAGPIDIVPGQNDGWQRLRLTVVEDRVSGNFGGTFGVNDGVQVQGTAVTLEDGDVFVAYREAVLYNQNGTAGCHPLLLDRVRIRERLGGQYTLFGAGCAGTLGVPTNTALSLPQLGETMAVELGNLPPFSPALFWIGFSDRTSPIGPLPIDLGLLGAPGCALFASPDVTFSLFSSVGSAVVPLSIPNTPSLAGIRLFTQGLVVDPGANRLGMVLTNAADLVIGN